VLLIEKGVPAVMLGAQTPPDSFERTVRETRASGSVLVCHRPQIRRSSLVALRMVARVRRTRVYYAGNGFASARGRRSVPGTYLGTDLSAAAERVRSDRAG
jgi:hypothetical protein